MEGLGLGVLGDMLHVEEFDEERFRSLAVLLKRREADAACDMIEEAILRHQRQQLEGESPAAETDQGGMSAGGDGSPISWGLLLVDGWFSAVRVEVQAVHVRVDDPRARTCMGLYVGRLSFQPLPPVQASLGAPHRKVEVVELKLYVDPWLDVWPPANLQHMYMLQVNHTWSSTIRADAAS